MWYRLGLDNYSEVAIARTGLWERLQSSLFYTLMYDRILVMGRLQNRSRVHIMSLRKHGQTQQTMTNTLAPSTKGLSPPSAATFGCVNTSSSLYELLPTSLVSQRARPSYSYRPTSSCIAALLS